jgi:hypothetical protein
MKTFGVSDSTFDVIADFLLIFAHPLLMNGLCSGNRLDLAIMVYLKPSLVFVQHQFTELNKALYRLLIKWCRTSTQSVFGAVEGAHSDGGAVICRSEFACYPALLCPPRSKFL